MRSSRNIIKNTLYDNYPLKKSYLPALEKFEKKENGERQMLLYALDDEQLMLEALVDSLREVFPQADIVPFRKPSDFLEAFQKKPSDIAFLDIQMPRFGGVSVAEKMIESKKDINFVFVTGYDSYKGDAMELYASDYILKPVTADKVRKAVEHLRYPLPKEEPPFRAVTFGDFCLFYKDIPVAFHRRKSKELLAFLIAREGTVVSRTELTYALFEDECHSPQSQKRLDNAVHTLKEDLSALGGERILYSNSNGLAVQPKEISADLWDYRKGNTHVFNGQFMEQYTWGEYFKGSLK